jgi:hypothetical protein
MTSDMVDRATTLSAGFEAPVSRPRTSLGARRRTQRLVMPALRVLIEGHAHVTTDWSLGGLLVESYAGALRPGDDFSVPSVGPIDGPFIPVGIRGRVMRREGEALAAEFLELDGRAFDALEALMRRRRQYLASLAATARAVA